MMDRRRTFASHSFGRIMIGTDRNNIDVAQGLRPAIAAGSGNRRIMP